MLRFLRLFLALLLSQVLLFFVFLFFVGAFLASRDAPPTIHPGSGLSVYLSGELVEYSTLPTVPFLREEPQTESVILEGLRRAAADPNITGVLLDFEAATLGWGMVQELHQAVLRYRESGKQAWAYGPMLDEVDLYLASACDSVFVPPHGKVFLNGIAFGSMYFRGLLDKAGVRPNVHRIGAYKDAAEPFTRTSMSEESRRQAEWLLDDLWEQLLGGIATARKLERPALDAALQRGMLSGREAAALGLIDGERQHQDLAARFGHDHGKPRLVSVERYGRARDPAPRPGPGTIAVVHTRGLILAGRHTYSPGLGAILGAESVVRDLQEAAADDAVEAIVLRIDSPGGEVVASDVIGHAVQRARAVKPVVVSMVDVAASGGYMMAYRASRIVALPSTITGSIGSLLGKPDARGLYDKLGIRKDFVTRGDYPFLYSDYHSWTAAEESLIAREHWADYRHWIDDIAQQRDLAAAAVDSVARGRVWTGRQALEHRLVDELGDLQHAIGVAQELGGLPADAVPRLLHLPRPMSLLEALREERRSLLGGVVEGLVRELRLPRGVAWAVLDLQTMR